MVGRGRVRLGLIEGDLQEGSLLSGQIAGLIKEIMPVKSIIENTISQAEILISHLQISCPKN
jgi:enoyl-[acyl-carrier protein] reductase II